MGPKCQIYFKRHNNQQRSRTDDKFWAFSFVNVTFSSRLFFSSLNFFQTSFLMFFNFTFSSLKQMNIIDAASSSSKTGGLESFEM